MEAFSPGASLPLRGLIVGVGFRAEAGLRPGPFFLFVWKWRAMRVPKLSVLWEVQGGMFPKASVIAGCRDALLTARGEGPFWRLFQTGVKMSRQCGAMERSIVRRLEILVWIRRQSSGLFDESSVLRYLSV